jgi:hypothetical protein
MTERPDFGPDEVLTPEQLAQLLLNYARLSVPSLQQAYSEALERCKLARPSAAFG